MNTLTETNTDPIAAEQNRLVAAGSLDPARRVTVLHLSTGEEIALPTAILLTALERATVPGRAVESSQAVEGTLIPLIAEQLVIGKEVVPTGTLRLTKHTDERSETVEMPLTRTTWHVEHVPIDRIVTEVPPVRYEGDTTVYPVIDEHLIVRREMRLREEVRVTRTATTTIDTQTITLHSERVVETRS